MTQVMNTLGRPPLAPNRGEGVRLREADDRRCRDTACGVTVDDLDGPVPTIARLRRPHVASAAVSLPAASPADLIRASARATEPVAPAG